MKRFILGAQKPILVILVILLILTLSPVVASAKTIGLESQEPVTFEETITVTDLGGNFNVGFTKIKFSKDCLPEEELPLVVDVEIYAENGKVYIEFTPDVAAFNKPVKISAKAYKGLIYDRATGESIYVKIPGQTLWVTHFSRYCFVF